MENTFIEFKSIERFLKKTYGKQFSYILSENEMYEITDVFHFQPFHGIFRVDKNDTKTLIGKIFVKQLKNDKTNEINTQTHRR